MNHVTFQSCQTWLQRLINSSCLHHILLWDVQCLRWISVRVQNQPHNDEDIMWSSNIGVNALVIVLGLTVTTNWYIYFFFLLVTNCITPITCLWWYLLQLHHMFMKLITNTFPPHSILFHIIGNLFFLFLYVSMMFCRLCSSTYISSIATWCTVEIVYLWIAIIFWLLISLW